MKLQHICRKKERERKRKEEILFSGFSAQIFLGQAIGNQCILSVDSSETFVHLFLEFRHFSFCSFVSFVFLSLSPSFYFTRKSCLSPISYMGEIFARTSALVRVLGAAVHFPRFRLPDPNIVQIKRTHFESNIGHSRRGILIT